MKHKFRSCTALLMALCMVFSLAACGQSGSTGSDTKPSGTKNTEPTPEFTYTASFTKLRENSKDDSQPQTVTADGFYSVGNEKVGDNTPEGVTPDYEGQYDVYAPYITFTDFSGKVTKLESYVPVEEDQSNADKRDYASSHSIAGIAVNDDGSLTVIENVYLSWSDAPADIKSDSDDYYNYYQSENAYYLRVLDKTGAEVSSAKLEADTSNDDFYVSQFVLDESGNALVMSNIKLTAFAPDGSLAYEIPVDGYIYSIATLRDGRIGVLAMDMSSHDSALNIVDSKAGVFDSTSYTMPFDAYNLISGGGDYDLYYTSGINFYGYSLETETAEKLFSWISCDVDSNELALVNVSDDGTISGFTGGYDDKAETYSLDYVTVTKVPYDSVPQKISLSMATMYVDYSTQKAVIDFNRSNDKYRVDLIDYSEYNTEDDYNAGLTKFNTEIMAGNMPDILALDTQTPYRQYAAKGLLEDLYPYIDADSELDRSDYFPNVFAALEVNGGLYTACAGFGILSAVGATSIVGDTPGWTYDEYYEALAKMPEGCEGFDYGYDRNTLLTLCLALDMDDYMDWSTGECRFDSEDFVKLLEFANQNKTDFDYENAEYTEEDTAANRIREGKQMLTSANFFSADYMYNNFEQTFGAPVTIKGFPTMHGVGNMITIQSSYAMSSTCQHKDAAWQFLRTFLTEDYQKDVPYLPTNMNVFEKQLADSMVVEYEKDPNGNYMLDENGERIPVSKGMISDGVNTYTIYATTQEQADQLRQAIADTTKLMNYDMSIADIVTEQAAAYFSGQKSAEEVAKLIQSKANIYINEQR